MQSAPSPSLSGSRILVVEDEALIAEEIQDRLTRMKFQVVGIEDSGPKAIETAHRLRPDLVLMDIRLKGHMDGIDTAAEIRKRVNVPVVYMTAHSDPATLQRAKLTAPFGYILKPIHERELEITIEMAMHRHSLERRLRESELRHAATLTSIGDAVLSTDREGRVTFMNPVAEALTGWRNADAHQQPADQVLRLIDEQTHAPVDHPVAQALAAGAPVRLVRPMLLVARDGTTIPIDDSAAPIVDAEGNTLGVVVAFHDIRDRRLAEDALRKAEAELRQAQKLESIGQLAGGVAHDFNNFLTAINGYCELLLRSGSLTESNEKMVQQIRRAGERSAQLTSQLLAFSRQQLLSPRVIDVNALVQNTERLLRRLIGEHIEMHVTLADNLLNVRADPGQIEQILMNLAVNARDAMPDGGVLSIETHNFTIRDEVAEARPKMPPGRYVMLSVSDTGTGMDESTKARLFEPFFTTKEFGKGTGLGLATVYGIVKQSGGHIYVYSELGVGTVFKVFLPAVADRPDAEITAEAGAAPVGSETVLLVEDDDAVRQVVASVLSEYGYNVLSARNGLKAMELFRAHGDKVDVLITDTVMPGISGPQLALQLSRQRPALPVLFVSGYADRAMDQAIGQFPNARFLQKPFTLAVLARRVRELLDSSQA